MLMGIRESEGDLGPQDLGIDGYSIYLVGGLEHEFYFP